MDTTIALILLSVMNYTILINTSLFFGMSLVDFSLKDHYKKIIKVSLITGIVKYLGTTIFPDNIMFIFIYGALFFVLFFYFKMLGTQALVAILLGATFDLVVVKWFQTNLFDLLLSVSKTSEDPVIQISLVLFIMMNNVFISQILYRKSPVLLPNTWFITLPNDDEEQVNHQKTHLVFIITILVVYNVILIFMYVNIDLLNSNIRMFIMMMNIIVCILLFIFLNNVLFYQHERTQFFLDKQYQKDLYSFFKVIRSQRHDFNLHLTAINGLIQSGKFKECREYINEIVEDAQHINDLLPLRHPATAAMLNTMNELAAQKGITLQFDLKDDLRNNPCSVYETNKILGNLVQNAIEEVDLKDLGDRTIIVEIGNEMDQIVLKVTNETSMSKEQLASLFDIGYSTKREHEGLGLPTIEMILNNYNGIIFAEMNGQYLSINVRIPINQTK